MLPSESVVRLATPEDESSLLDLCITLWDENGLFPLNPDKVRETLHRGVYPQSDCPVVIGVIGEPGKIEASICMLITQLWYTDSWHLEELWNFVHPDYRGSGHAKALLDYSKHVQSLINIPLLIGILSSERTAAKLRLYRTRFGDPAGAYFVWPDWSSLKMKEHQRLNG